MTFKHWLRQTLGSRGRVARAAGRGKSRQPSRLRFVPRLDSMEDRLAPATFMVTTLADSGAGSLRAAIDASVSQASSSSPSNDIQFDPTLDGGTITLSTFENDLTAGSTMAGRVTVSLPSSSQARAARARESGWPGSSRS